MKTTAACAAASFSLVEVALAMAILAVGMTGVLALLPVGLDAARQVHAETVAAQIFRGALGDLPVSNAVSRSFVGNFGADFTYDGVLVTNQIAQTAYFRINVTRSNETANLSRYILTVNWPLVGGQVVTNRLTQERVVITDVLRNW